MPLTTKVMHIYGTSRGVQCSCISLITVSWILVRSPGQLDKLDLDGILPDLPEELLIESFSVNVKFKKIRLEKLQLGHISYLF